LGRDRRGSRVGPEEPLDAERVVRVVQLLVRARRLRLRLENERKDDEKVDDDRSVDPALLRDGQPRGPVFARANELLEVVGQVLGDLDALPAAPLRLRPGGRAVLSE
jgi:hypothetical protein